MSMLAARKRKTKWSLNPNGKAWSQDSNKFGQKMLEKMGWQQGKGLGPDGKGITEHIQASFKNDSKGMGYKESNDQWTEHRDNFSSLLESLNGGAVKPDEVKLHSLEKKSETSKARVHYHKFTRGKDISRYSEKDLANIFGKKTLNEPKREMQEEESDSNEGKNKYDSALLFNAGSMRDYFKRKLPNFGKTNGFVVGKNGVLKKEDSESESEARPSFGFGFAPKNDSEQTNNYEADTIKNGVIPYENNLENLPTSGNHKNKSKEIAKTTFVSYLDVEETNSKKNKKKRKGAECDEHSVLSPKKKSKKNDEGTPKKKSKVKIDENIGLSNPAFNPLPTPIKVQKHVLNTIQESISENSDLEESSPKITEVKAEVYVNEIEKRSETPKKKKSQNIEEISDIYNSEEKKSKKKKKIDNGFVNDVIVEDIENIPKKKQFNPSIESEGCTRTEENPYEMKIKKKKKKDCQLAIDNPNFDDTMHESINTSQTEENPYEVKVKKKKKKKEEQFALENCNFNPTLENSVDSSPIVNLCEVKVKEKKKKKVKEEKFALSNPSFDGSEDKSTDFSQIEENPYKVKVKKKKKEHFGLENCNFNPTLENSVDSSQIEVNPCEVKVKEKKRNKVKEEKFALSNPSFDASEDKSTDSFQVEENPYEVKVKKKKKKDQIGLENCNFNPTLENSVESSQIEVNPCEVKVKEKKKNKVKEAKSALSNPSFHGSGDKSTGSSQIEENPYEVKVKKKKKKGEQFALENGNFNPTLENSVDSSQFEVNPYEVKVKEKKKKKVKEEKLAKFDGSAGASTDSSQVEENPQEVKVKNKSKKKKQQEIEISTNSAQVNETSHETSDKKKKKKKEAFAIDNPHFDPSDSLEVDTKNNTLEVERKKKKQKKVKEEGGIVNPALNLDTSQESKEIISEEIEESDIMLNVVTTPIVTKSMSRNEENTYSITKTNSVKRTKSVRFSNVAQERIIPNNAELRTESEIEIESEMFSSQLTNGYSERLGNSMDESPLSYDENRSKKGKKRKLGLDNAAFDKQKNTLEENLDSISRTIDMYQAEIENDINEKKLEPFEMDDIMVGEVGNPHGENERLPDGSMLKFKYAHFKSRTPFYQLNKTGSKKSYKHLIKGDIVVKFKNANLHEISGYAAKAKSTI